MKSLIMVCDKRFVSLTRMESFFVRVRFQNVNISVATILYKPLLNLLMPFVNILMNYIKIQIRNTIIICDDLNIDIMSENSSSSKFI